MGFRYVIPPGFLGGPWRDSRDSPSLGAAACATPFSFPSLGNPSDPLGTESPAENCRQRPGLRPLRGLGNVDGVEDVVSESNDTAESKVETAMEVSLNLLKDSRRPQGYKPDAWGTNLIPGVTN